MASTTGSVYTLTRTYKLWQDGEPMTLQPLGMRHVPGDETCGGCTDGPAPCLCGGLRHVEPAGMDLGGGEIALVYLMECDTCERRTDDAKGVIR